LRDSRLCRRNIAPPPRDHEKSMHRPAERGDAAYMIVTGRCRAFRQVDGGIEELTLMGPGEVFGEMALLLDETRAASVEALDQVTLLVLDKTTMTEGLGIDGWTGALVRALAQRFRDLELQVRTSGMRRSLRPPMG
jgi:serine/threonine-protein kinase